MNLHNWLLKVRFKSNSLAKNLSLKVCILEKLILSSLQFNEQYQLNLTAKQLRQEKNHVKQKGQ